MNVIIKIKEREAIPVRALPFLSDRKTMSPDVVAKALAGTEANGRFVGLCAYRMEHGVVTSIAERWWQTGPCQKLDALSATISAEECPGEHETEDEYQKRHDRELAKWRDKSPGLLPAGVFVFKDEFEQLYRNEFKFGHYYFKGDDGQWLSELDHNKRISLDYSPFFDNTETATLVMAGFDAIGTAKKDVSVNAGEQQSTEANAPECLELIPAGPAVEPASDAPAPAKPNWRHLIQAEAREHWLRLRASGCNPSIYSICSDMARWCADNGIKGDKGQDPKAGTIRNTVLGGGHWTPPHHSVAEAKKHIAQIAQTKAAQTAQ